MFKHWYLIVSVLFFAFGAYVWKVRGRNTPMTASPPSQDIPASSKFGSVIVEVGKDKILREDIEWEYSLLTHGIVDNTNLTPIPNLGSKFHEELGPLKRSILENIIERKLLFAMVKRDDGFDSTNPARFTSCLSDWQKSLAGLPKEVADSGARDRLKSRLCERSLVEQYLAERVYSEVSVPEKEMSEYFKDHPEEFKVPEKVRIRQTVVADESTAKRVLNQTTVQNFSDMARQYSITPEGRHGGKLGPFGKQGMPSFFEVAFEMRKGQLSPVLKSNYGYHIMIVDEKIPEHGMSFDEAAKVIEEKLLVGKKEVAYRAWVDRALVAVSIKAPSALW